MFVRIALLLLSAAAVSAGCGSGSTSVLAPSGPRCTLTISPDKATTSAAGGTGSFTVTTARECQWTVATPAPWIQLGANGGQGTGSISYEVTPNRSTDARSDVVAIGDLKATVTQQAASCAFSASPSSLSVGPAGGDLTTTLTTDDFCGWAALSQVPWVTVQSAAGTGSATVRLNSQQNPGAARSGVVTVAGQTVTVNQAAAPPSPAPPAPLPPPSSPPCSYALTPFSYSAPLAGGSLHVAITAGSGCGWTVSGVPGWITAQPVSGSGNGQLTLTVTANGGIGRTASMSIGGQTLAVNQAGTAVCNYAINPSSLSNVSSTGGSVTVSITTTAGCAWTAAGNPGWITLSRASGSGSGTTSVSVQTNSGAARSTSFQIAGAVFSVSQLALCTYSVTPASFAVSNSAQSQTIALTTQPGCTATATSSVPWIQITSVPAQGGGNIVIAVDRNNAHNVRSGDVTVTGQSFARTISVAQDQR